MAIADDLVGHAHIAYLGDPFEQYCGLNGKPLIGGWIEVYHAGTDTRYITMQNFDGAMNPFKVPLNADGRVVMLADPSLTYDIYVRNSYGDLVCSRLNVECTCPGNISINGSDTRINNTDGTLDVSLRTLGDNVRQYTINTHNKILDIQEPLYFVENSNTATIIGFSGDSSSSISGKMDESKLEYNSTGEISAYNGSAFASQGGGAGDPAVNALVHSNSATWNEVSAKLDTTAFSTVSGSFLTAHQSLDGYATHDDLTAYQPSGDYANATALDSKVDISSFTAFSSTTNEKIEYISGALSGTYELSAGEGIDITDYPNEHKTVISVTAQGGNPVVSHDNTLSGNGTSASPLGVVQGYNETVLFSGDLTASTTAQLSESWKNFEEIRCYGYSGPGGAMFGCGRTNDLLSAYTDNIWCPDIGLNTVAAWAHRDNFSINANMPLVFSADNSVASLNGRLLGYWNDQWRLSTSEQRCHCTLILGINRKQ